MKITKIKLDAKETHITIVTEDDEIKNTKQIELDKGNPKVNMALKSLHAVAQQTTNLHHIDDSVSSTRLLQLKWDTDTITEAKVGWESVLAVATNEGSKNVELTVKGKGWITEAFEDGANVLSASATAVQHVKDVFL